MMLESTPVKDKSSVLEQTEVVTDHERCAKIVEEIINLPNPIIAFDCEGNNVGITGIITLAQVGLPDGRAFIFDVLQGARLVTLGRLKDLLESTKVLKVMHDCRGDSVNLRKQYGIHLRNVFDTQAAQTVLLMQETGDPIAHMKHIGLREMCRKYEARFELARKDKSIYYRTGAKAYWENRPLTPNMLEYAALDVLCLVPEVHNSLERQILPELKFVVEELSIEQSLANDNKLVKEYREQLKKLHKTDIERLQDEIIGAAVAKKRIELSYRDISLIRFLTLPPEVKEFLRQYYKPHSIAQKPLQEGEG